MVFIRPKILRDGVATAIETDAKYNYIREEQRSTMRPKTEILPLLPVQRGAAAAANPGAAAGRESARLPSPMNPDGSSPEAPPAPPPAAPTGEGAPPKP